jgi:DNA-binding response OmpR family regulator
MSIQSNDPEPNVEVKSEKQLPKILVVDDETDLRESLVEILTREGYVAKSANCGKEALKLCQKEQFDLALVDIRLPDIEGPSLLGELNACAPEMAKIMVTGFPSLETAVQSLYSGANGYIVKPFEPTQLLNQIKEQLRKRQENRWENLLVNLGLSIYETKIYLALATEKCLEVRRLSMLSGVPRTKTYASLGKLVQRGLVVESPGKTQKFSVTKPSIAFKTIIQNKKKELSEQAGSLVELENTISLLDSAVRKNSGSETLKKGDFWSIQGTDEIESVISDMLSKAERSVSASISENSLVLFLKRQRKMLANLAIKKVNVQLNVPESFSNPKLLEDLMESYKIERRRLDGSFLLLYVDENALLLSNLYSTVRHSEGSFAVVFQNSGVEQFLANLFNPSEIT